MDEARNLDYLLAVCVKQHSGGDLESFLKDVAPHIGQAAPWLKIGGGGGGAWDRLLGCSKVYDYISKESQGVIWINIQASTFTLAVVVSRQKTFPA